MIDLVSANIEPNVGSRSRFDYSLQRRRKGI